jgi:hypothetical protein
LIQGIAFVSTVYAVPGTVHCHILILIEEILFADSLLMICLKLTSMFGGLGPANQFLTRQLKLKVRPHNFLLLKGTVGSCLHSRFRSF